jgi:hypothetical protein
MHGWKNTRWQIIKSGRRQFEAPFSEHDLSVNRAGNITDRQRKMLQRWAESSERQIFLLRASWGVLGSLCIFLALLFQNPSLLLVGGGLLLLYTVVTFFLYRSFDWLKRDLAENIIPIAEGEVAYQPRFLSEGFVFVVDEVDLGMANWAIRPMFKRGDNWRVYYLPRSKFVLSAEPLI